MEVNKESIINAFATVIFAVSGLMNLSATVLQRTLKKRQCASVVLFIEIVAFSTNLLQLLRAFPVVNNVEGRPFDWYHFLQWSFTTPAMLLILSSLGTSMEEQFVVDWPLTLRAILYDELMLLSGLLAMYFTGQLRIICFIVACCCFIKLCALIGNIIHLCIESSGTAGEVQTLVVLKWVTYALWSFFGIFQVPIKYFHPLTEECRNVCPCFHLLWMVTGH